MSVLASFRSRAWVTSAKWLRPATPRKRSAAICCPVATFYGVRSGVMDRQHLSDGSTDETDDDDSCSLILDWNVHTAGAARCALLRLERLVRYVSAAGGARALFCVLSHRRRQLIGSMGFEHSTPLSSAAMPTICSPADTKAAEQHLRKLFSAADTNADGELDSREFQAALNVLGSTLGPIEMEQVAAALQVGGHISEAEFMEIASVL